MNIKEVKLFNSLNQKVETFKPLVEGKVGLYSCGPTVYSYQHIGNLRAFLFADTLRRALVYAGYDVNHVMNITDVGHLTDDGDDGEDKLEVGARKEGITAWDVAKKYTEFFLGELKKANIRTPDHVCKATDYIAEQIALVKRLEDKGYTYNTSDGVYFDTSKYEQYGAMARLDKEGMQAGMRIELGEKKSKTDFALWKLSPKDGEKRAMEWESPWGVGFPGWHIECSAMSMAFLGEQFDIHTGGVDHIPVHHSNEIAQSECATGLSPFVNYWMHCEFLILDDGTQKMSKSLGNIITLSQVEETGIPPLAFRYLVLNSHYRKQMQFSMQALSAAATAYERLRRLCFEVTDNTKAAELQSKKAIHYQKQMSDALLNDLNTSKVLANLWVLLEDSDISNAEKATLVAEHETILALGCGQCLEDLEVKAPPEVLSLLKQRQEMRQTKNWAEADRLRDEIHQAGYEICDDAGGAYVRRLKDC